ncbi:hypothetical protein WMF26_24775 [Sorangium sp. So ce185]
MRFVDDDHLRARELVEDGRVGRPDERVLQHRIVRHQDVRRLLAELLARDELRARHGQPELLELPFGHLRRLRQAARVQAEADGRMVAKNRPQPIHLVVHQRVQGIEEEHAYAGSLQVRIAKELVQRGEEEALGLAAARARRDDERFPLPVVLDRLDLVPVERAVGRPLRLAARGLEQRREIAVHDPCFRQLAGRLRAEAGQLEGKVRLHDGGRDEPEVRDRLVDRVVERRIAEAKRGPNEARHLCQRPLIGGIGVQLIPAHRFTSSPSTRATRHPEGRVRSGRAPRWRSTRPS